MTSSLSMNFNTPTKASSKNQLNSSRRKILTNSANNNSSLNSSSYKQYNKTQAAIQNSLLQKMIQNEITRDEQYQNRLIYNKQLQLKILNLQQKAQLLRKQYKRANKPLQQIKQKIQKSKLSLIEKQKYLEKYYIHLDSKLQTNMQSNLFNRLSKIQQTLQQKYQQQRSQLYETLSEQHQQIEKQNQKLQKLKQYRDQLIKQYTSKTIEILSHRGHSQKGQNSNRNQSSQQKSNKNSNPQNQSVKNSNHQKQSIKSLNLKSKQNQLKLKEMEHKQRKQAKIKQKKQVQEELVYLKQNIKKLDKQKQIIQKEEKILKTLLNIDQQHKKFSSYIINGFKKLFAIKFRQVLAKRKIAQSQQKQAQSKAPLILPSSYSGPSPQDLQNLQKQLSQKNKQRKHLEAQLQQRNKGFQKCKLKYQQQIQQYHRLQGQLQQYGKGNYGGNRMSYAQASYQANDGYNPRSTYLPMKHTF